jgi:nucleoid DNA-binding protein
VTKRKIAERYAAEAGIPVARARRLVAAVFRIAGDCLVEHGRLELRGFAVIVAFVRPGRQARNPRTGVRVEVGPRPAARVALGRELRGRLAVPAVPAGGPEGA